MPEERIGGEKKDEQINLKQLKNTIMSNPKGGAGLIKKREDNDKEWEREVCVI